VVALAGRVGDGHSLAAAGGRGFVANPAELLRHHALFVLPDGTPFSEVVETYTQAILDFPEPSVH
jgi:hypothetical protein